jgi:hypothetical protein
MAKFLKNLKGLFIATDEDLIKAEANKNQKPAQDAVEATSTESIASETLAAIDKEVLANAEEGSVDQKFLDILLDSVTQNNQEGYDYLEYKQALRSLNKMDMDEETRFKSAYAMAQTMGASKDKLLKSGELYLNVLKSEEEKFMLSLGNQRQIKIDERRQDLLNIDKWIADKEAQIEKLKQQIETKRASKADIQSELTDTAKKIQEVHNNFQTTYTYLSGQIREDLNKIKDLIK